MKSAVETLSPTRVRLDIEVPFSEFQSHVDQAYKTIATSVNIPGFRKGKVPNALIDQRFGRQFEKAPKFSRLSANASNRE